MNDTVRRLLDDPIAHYPQATVACFDPTMGALPRRALDVERTQLFLEKLAAAGAPAVLIAASTGQGHLRTVEELDAWFTAATAASAPGMMRMALLRPEDGLVANERLLERLRALEYPVVFFRPGTDLAKSADEDTIVESLRPLVEAAAQRELAVGLYSIPDVSGVRLTADAAARLVDGPGGEAIVAAKITEANYEGSTLEYLIHPALERLKIVQGWDPFIVRALQDGKQRAGVTSGPMSLAVFQYVHLLDAAAREDWSEAEAAIAAVTTVFQAMQDDAGKFADLQRAKVVMGLGQPLLGEVTPPQVERVLAALRSLARPADRQRIARSLDLMGDGPFHDELQQYV
jgi:dihydrodipicolinate synthase/N-acetylneuraminate lyase